MFSLGRAQCILRNHLKATVFSLNTIQFSSNDEIEYSEDSEQDRQYETLVKNYFHLQDVHNCLVIQPYVKWGPKKLTISPEEQLEEAIALIKTLPSWNVEQVMTIPLDNLEKKSLFKSGNMEKLVQTIRKNRNITAVYINTSNLKRVTAGILYDNFKLPILDRYKIVMQILKVHAKSKHAKLQVALAELYFIRRKAETSNLFHSSDPEVLKLMFQEKESKLKKEISDLRNHRQMLRKKRKILDYPVVAVVGYTNAGKTCLIKGLTGEESLQPRNQLFATLDVTLHAGLLPSRLEVIYVDTVGFLSDLPTNLIECFIATLEDAVLADVVLHVEDISSSSFLYKRNHVLTTLKDLGAELGSENILEKVISIGNKCDLVEKLDDFDVMPISAKNGTGLNDLLHKLENRILEVTSRMKITMRIKSGGDELRWLYKNATVLSTTPDETNTQLVKVRVIITNTNLNKFKHYYT